MAVECVATKMRLLLRLFAQEMEKSQLRFGMQVGFRLLDADPRPRLGQDHLGHDGHQRARAKTHLIHRINQVFVACHPSCPAWLRFEWWACRACRGWERIWQLPLQSCGIVWACCCRANADTSGRLDTSAAERVLAHGWAKWWAVCAKDRPIPSWRTAGKSRRPIRTKSESRRRPPAGPSAIGRAAIVSGLISSLTGSAAIRRRSVCIAPPIGPHSDSTLHGVPLMEKITNSRLPAMLGVESSSVKPSRVDGDFEDKAERKSELSGLGAGNCELPAKRRWMKSIRLSGSRDELEQELDRLLRLVCDG